MIYSKFGAPIKIVKSRKDREGCWEVTAKQDGTYPDGSGRKGDQIWGGRYAHVSHLRADGGMEEIINACEEAR